MSLFTFDLFRLSVLSNSVKRLKRKIELYIYTYIDIFLDLSDPHTVLPTPVLWTSAKMSSEIA